MLETRYQYQAEVLKAIAHPTRLQILYLLKNGEQCVCKIVPELKMEQSNVSRHLNILKKEGLVSSRKEGLKVFYRVTDSEVFQLLEISSDLLKKYWERRQKMLVL